MLVAVTRDVSPSIQRCELTHLDRVAIDLNQAIAQHARYREVLVSLGVRVVELPAQESFPDSVFVEDVALVLDEIAILTRPGILSRRGEVKLMEPVLSPYREIVHIGGEGSVDGGDLLVLGKEILVGISGRTNQDGLRQIQHYLDPYGYTARGVAVFGCLHLKSAATAIDDETVLLNENLVDTDLFSGYRRITADPREPAAANILRVGEETVFPIQYPRTLERVQKAGFHPHCIDNSELVKAEGALTCCSLIFKSAP